MSIIMQQKILNCVRILITFLGQWRAERSFFLRSCWLCSLARTTKVLYATLCATRHRMTLDKSLTAVCLGRCILIMCDIHRLLWLVVVVGKISGYRNCLQTAPYAARRGILLLTNEHASRTRVNSVLKVRCFPLVQ